MNKVLSIALLMSILIHVQVVILLILIKVQGPQKKDLVFHPELSLALEMSVYRPALQEPISAIQQPDVITKQKVVSEKPVPLVHESGIEDMDALQVEPGPQPMDSIYHVTHDSLYMIDSVYLAKGDYIPMSDSLFKGRPGTPFYRPDKNDLPADQFNLPRLLFQGAKKVTEIVKGDPGPPKLDFIPTQTELEALAVIWEHKHITDQNIYSVMDTSIKASAEELHRVLAELVNRGLLKRKIVSPQYKVMLFVAEVEVSPKNIRNRIYEYEPLVDKAQMRRFLNALYYQIKTGEEADFVKESTALYNAKHVKKLIDRLYLDRETDE